MILTFILSSLLPDSVIVRLFGGSSLDRVVVKRGRKTFRISASRGYLYVNGVRKRIFTLRNASITYPIKRRYKGRLIFKPKKNGVRVYNKVYLEDYLVSVVASEIGNAPLEAVKAQAVLARTFLARWGLRHGDAHACDGNHCQVYKGVYRISKVHIRAVKETRGEILTYEGRPVEVLYHASCGGWICEPKYIWKGGRKLPYFWTGEDEDCFKDTNDRYTWKVFVPLNTCPKIKRIPGTLRVYMLIVGKDTLYANDFRKRYNLPSAVFAYWCTSTGVIFIGTGRGHGTGLCQRGAIIKARRGWKYKDILEYYYKGATVVKVK